MTSFTIVVQFKILKVYFLCTFFKKIYFRKKWEIIFLNLNKTDTSIHFLTLEKVAVSLPTKCLSDPTIGSVLISGYRFGPAHFPGFAYINRMSVQAFS